MTQSKRKGLDVGAPLDSGRGTVFDVLHERTLNQMLLWIRWKCGPLATASSRLCLDFSVRILRGCAEQHMSQVSLLSFASAAPSLLTYCWAAVFPSSNPKGSVGVWLTILESRDPPLLYRDIARRVSVFAPDGSVDSLLDRSWRCTAVLAATVGEEVYAPDVREGHPHPEGVRAPPT